MVDDAQGKLIMLVMIAVMGAIGGSGFVAALRTGSIPIRRPVGSATGRVERDAHPREFRRVLFAHAAMLAFLTIAFVAILFFA